LAAGRTIEPLRAATARTPAMRAISPGLGRACHTAFSDSSDVSVSPLVSLVSLVPLVSLISPVSLICLCSRVAFSQFQPGERARQVF